MVTRVLVLSEDSGKDGRLTAKCLLERVLISWNGRTRALEIDAESASPPMAFANLWRSEAQHLRQEKVSFLRRLATELGLGAIVVFHYDGDTTWSKRAEALTPPQFAQLRTRLMQLDDKYTARSARLIEMVPHYSIESWTYQAIDRAVVLCQQAHEGRGVEQFERWRFDRRALDETLDPKGQTVLGSKHNADLARHVPAAEVVGLDMSMAAFVRVLQGVPELAARLRPEVVEQLSALE